jgi:hypothetical protein
MEGRKEGVREEGGKGVRECERMGGKEGVRNKQEFSCCKRNEKEATRYREIERGLLGRNKICLR